MGEEGGDLESGKNICSLAIGEGMTARGGNGLRPERGKFYVDDGVEVLVRSGEVHTSQWIAVGDKGGTSPGALPRTDGDPPDGRLERQDCATAIPSIGRSGNLNCGPWPGGPGTTILTSLPIPWTEGLGVADVEKWMNHHEMGRLHLRI